MNNMWNEILDKLAEEKLLNKEQINSTKSLHEQKKTSIGIILTQAGYISEKDLTSFLSDYFHVPAFDVETAALEDDLINFLPSLVAQKYLLIPIKRETKALHVVMANPVNINILDDIRFITDLDIIPYVASEASIKRVLDKLFGSEKQPIFTKGFEDVFQDDGVAVEVEKTEDAVVDLETATSDAQDSPVVSLVNSIIKEAVKRGASDIHIEPFDKLLRVRYRIDGAVQIAMCPNPTHAAGMVSKIKLMSNLDITEKRLPQDGHVGVNVGGKKVDLRISTLPIRYGESVVVRIADKSALDINIDNIGIEGKPLDDFKKALGKPNGMILVTGPTGSGKTVTLYSAIDYLNKSDVKILTAEDPVEYDIKGICQVNVREDIGYNFAKALRAFLRQDPDIVMVGEIRDKETIDIAIKASLTGHLVLSTLHTNNTAATIIRIRDMDVPNYLISSSISLIIAQRLMRRLCPYCSEETNIDKEIFREMRINPDSVIKDATFKRAVGCELCDNTGYKGRTAIFEIMTIDNVIRELINSNATQEQLMQAAKKEGMISLRVDALRKLKSGIVDLNEVIRSTI